MADFFEDQSIEGVAERHVRELQALEKSKAEEVLKLYKEIRRDIQDRLLSLPRGTFSYQRLGGVLLQVNTGIDALSNSLKRGMGAASRDTAELGVEHLTTELNEWNEQFTGAVSAIDLDSVLIANEVQQLNISRYESSLSAYSESVRADISRGLTEAVVQEMPLGEVVNTVGQYFKAEQWKLLQIARTELHNIYSQGKLNAMTDLQETSMPDLKKTLWHPMDSRTGDDSKYVARKDLIVPVDKPFRYKWKGVERVFMSPPDRPNDRSILIPYRESWSK
jgi:hypothetical protein